MASCVALIEAITPAPRTVARSPLSALVCGIKKAPDDAGAFNWSREELSTRRSRSQYFRSQYFRSQYYITQQLRGEEIADTTCHGPNVLDADFLGERVDGETRKRGRNDVRAADPTVVVHALDADHPIIGELVVATDLTARRSR